MKVGPPVSRETGRDLSLRHHQLALLHLKHQHTPSVFMGVFTELIVPVFFCSCFHIVLLVFLLRTVVLDLGIDSDL